MKDRPDKMRWMLFSALIMAAGPGMAQTCHYQDWRWNVAQQRAVQHTTVIKDTSQLAPDEIDAQSGCTVCAEDQQAIRIAGLPEFSVCRKYAHVVHEALERLIRQGVRIDSIIAYRVGRTRGEIDAQGNRTGFSNHSFGIAIDINTDHNGLYADCARFGEQCRLVRGGPWRPHVDPYSIEPDGMVVATLKEAGFRWGGEIAGSQKDFMHFSLTGY